MRLVSNTFADLGLIPDDCAFGIFGSDGKLKLGKNLNPHLCWHDVPAGVRSLALINDDLDVPVDVATFNLQGAVVSRDQTRRALCHWVLLDISTDCNEIGFGEFSDGVTVGGKPGPNSLRGTRQGVNEYTDWFRSDAAMAGDYFGYDGPCPPFNDELPHRYEFVLYALDIPRLNVEGRFGKEAALTAMQGHVLATAKLTGLFSSNTNVRKDLCRPS